MDFGVGASHMGGSGLLRLLWWIFPGKSGTYMKDTIAFDSDGKDKVDEIIFLGV